jgi:RND family efflux transporter MFP subunit
MSLSGLLRGAALAGLVLLACSCGAKKLPEAALPKYKAKTIVTKSEKYSPDIASFGSLSFRTKTDIAATVEGTLVELPVAEGSAVKAGALLARLENVQLEMRKRQAESAVASASSALELAEARLWEGRLQVEARIVSLAKARIQIEQKAYEVAELESSYAKKKSLLDIGGATEEEVNSLLVSLNAQRSALAAQEKDLEVQRIGLRDEDLSARGLPAPSSERERLEALAAMNTRTLEAEEEVARSQLDSAAMELDSVSAMMGELELKAPASGIVGALYAERGEHLQQNAKVMTLMDIDAVYAVFPVQESEAGWIRAGMPVELSVDALNGRIFQARIDLVSPIIDAQTGAVTMKALMRNPSMSLRPGMFVRARVNLGAPRDVLKLPASAIAQKKGASAKVFTIVNGRAFVAPVELGQELGGAYIVEKGLREGEIVIDSPSPLLKEGEDVEMEG